MSHIHIPDGVISLWLCVLGYMLVGMYLFAFSRHIKKTSNYKKLALASVLGALMLLSMSLPVPFVIPYHINLSALAGIIAGPFYAGITIFSVNLILALIGHGGISIVGLNTIVITIEAVIAFFLFNVLKKKLNVKVFIAGFIATFCALIVSASLTLGIIYAGTKNLENFIHHHEHGIEAGHHEENEPDHDFDIKRFLTFILITGAFGWSAEAFITGVIVNYINRVKPDLLEDNN